MPTLKTGIPSPMTLQALYWHWLEHHSQKLFHKFKILIFHCIRVIFYKAGHIWRLKENFAKQWHSGKYWWTSSKGCLVIFPYGFCTFTTTNPDAWWFCLHIFFCCCCYNIFLMADQQGFPVNWNFHLFFNLHYFTIGCVWEGGVCVVIFRIEHFDFTGKNW